MLIRGRLFGQGSDANIVLTGELAKLTIKGKSQAFRPVHAIKSLLRSAWLFLTPDQRAECRLIHSVLNDDTKITPFEFLEGVIPGANPLHLSFQVWKKHNQQFPGADLVVLLQMGPKAIVWNSPCTVRGQYIPTLLPPIESEQSDPPPRISLRRIDRLDYTWPAKEVSFSLVGKIEEAATEGKAQSSLSEALRFLSEKQQITLKATFGKEASITLAPLHYKRTLVGDQLTGIVEGPKLAVAIEFPLDDESRITSCTFIKRFHKSHIEDVLNTLSLLRLIANPNSTLSISQLDGKTILEFDSSGFDHSSLEEYWNLARWTDTINKAFRTNLRLPEFPTKADYAEAKNLADAVERMQLECPNGRFTIRLLQIDAALEQALKRAERENQRLAIDKPAPIPYKIFGKKIQIKPSEIRAKRAKVVYSSDSPSGTAKSLKFEGLTLLLQLP